MKVKNKILESIASAWWGRLFSFIVVLLISMPACEKWIDPAINQSPDRPVDVTMEALLPYIEADVAFKIASGMELIMAQSIMIQQIDGIDRQMLGLSNYIINPSDLVWIWSDAYAEILMDCKVLREKAESMGSPYNAAISDILTAFTLGQLTDVWDRIPWTEALMGNEIAQPAYDDQESIYQAIFAMLDKAVDSLSVPHDPFGIKGDYFYEGDRVKWLRAAHALKARYYIHLSNRYGAQAYVDALEEVSLAFTSNDEDMQFNFGLGENESNPVYQFMRDRNDVRMGAYFINLLVETNDPRLPVFAYPDHNGVYSGSAPGEANGLASAPGPAVAAPDAPTFIITYAELLFIQAEVLFRISNSEVEVKSTLLQAISASLEKFGVFDADWLLAYESGLNGISGEDLFIEIMTQKYIATFLQPEAAHSWRRTDYPLLSPNPNGATSEIPTRYPYPISEAFYNENTPSGVKVTDRVWWD